jgi:hypothetical protein
MLPGYPKETTASESTGIGRITLDSLKNFFMTENEIYQLVQSIPDGQSATITVSDQNGNRKYLQGVFKESSPPFFFFRCKQEDLPGNLDTSRQCPFTSQDQNSQDVALIADIKDIINTNTIELVAKKTINAEDLRQFFRVTLRAPITVSFFPEESNDKREEWQITGETMDLSQSGVLAMLTAECRDTKNLDIELDLQNPIKKAFCVGHVVRTKRLKKDRWLTSFHFDQVSSTDLDAIAKNCFAEQRRQLRDKGQTF